MAVFKTYPVFLNTSLLSKGDSGGKEIITHVFFTTRAVEMK